MAAELKPYPAYKDSRVKWLGNVPEHWETKRLKSHISNTIDPVSERRSSEIYIALEHVESWTGKIVDIDHDTVFESQVKSFQPNDVLFGKLRPYLAKATHPRRSGVCVGEFLVLRPRESDPLPGYLDLWLRSKPVIDVISASTFGAKMPRADWQFIGNMSLLFPPHSEQRAIVRFLDHADRRIQRCIRIKENLIELLEEQRPAIIHQAVTGQIDVRTGEPYSAYKPSGVEWLGDVPEHWEIQQLKHLTELLNGIAFKPMDWKDSGTPIIRIENLNGGVDFNYTDRVDLPDRMLIQTGDLVFAWSGNRGTSFGPFEWKYDFPGYLNQHIFKLEGYCLDRKYFLRLLRAATKHVEDNAHGIIGLVHITKSALGTIRVPVAPPDEQATIGRFLDKATTSIDRGVAHAHRQIDLLREYRMRLIADVVTGKLDVREAAGRLPEVDPLAVDDELASGDVTDEGSELESEIAVAEHSDRRGSNNLET